MAETGETVFTPPPPPKSASPPRILVIGAGSRGQTYARAVAAVSNGVVVAVAEPDTYRRNVIGRECIPGWASDAPPEGSSFTSWRAYIAYEESRRERAARGDAGVPEGVDAAFVCVQDEMHREVVLALAALGGVHVMCEKPLATRLADCVDMYCALRESNAPESAGGKGGARGLVFSIGHVMRYSPHNMELRRLLLEEKVVGEILDVVHTEPVGWWHFAHSYVRGNWRREETSAPSLLAKCCHDIDVLLWLLCSPFPHSGPGKDQKPHLPSTISSSGSLKLFRRSRKPREAGSATNCLSCPAEPSCLFSAKRIYVDGDDGGTFRSLDSSNRSWPVNVVLPDIESYGDENEAKAALLAKLAEDYDRSTPDVEVRARNWFGRCVWDSDNDVCDSQVVTMTWNEEDNGNALVPEGERSRGAKTATLHMVAQTRKICQRFTHVYGEHGEVYADSETITVEDFRTGRTTVHRPRLESLGHGGGDNGLTRQFVLAVDRVKNHGWTAEAAQREYIGCTLDEVLRSHALVFCAEHAREDKKVLEFESWWRDEVEARLIVG